MAISTIRDSEFARESLKATLKTVNNDRRKNRKERMAERRRRSEAPETQNVQNAQTVQTVQTDDSTQNDVDEKSAMLLQIYSKAEKQTVQQSA